MEKKYLWLTQEPGIYLPLISMTIHVKKKIPKYLEYSCSGVEF